MAIRTVIILIAQVIPLFYPCFLWSMVPIDKIFILSSLPDEILLWTSLSGAFISPETRAWVDGSEVCTAYKIYFLLKVNRLPVTIQAPRWLQILTTLGPDSPVPNDCDLPATRLSSPIASKCWKERAKTSQQNAHRICQVQKDSVSEQNPLWNTKHFPNGDKLKTLCFELSLLSFLRKLVYVSLIVFSFERDHWVF